MRFISCCTAILLILIGLGEIVPAQQAQRKINAADVYLRGYLIMEDGMKLLQSSDFAGAYYKLKDAKDIFDSVFNSDPNWNPEIVEYRRKRVAELMESAKQSEITRRQRAAESSKTVRPTAPTPEAEKPKSALPMLPPRPPITAAAEPPSPPRPTDAVLQSKVADLQDRIRQLEAKNDGILKEIGSKDAQLAKLGDQLLESKNDQKRLLERLTDANTRLEVAGRGKNIEKAALQKEMQKEIDALKKERDKLQTDLTSAVALLDDSNKKNAQLLQEVRDAYATIKTLNDERAVLMKERDQMGALLAGDANKADKVKALATENNKLRKTMEELQGRIVALQKERDVEKKERDNEKKEVAQLKADLAKQREADQLLIADLRGELDKARGELVRLKQENEDYQNQMAALTERLDNTERALAESANPGLTESEAIKENNLLHEIIVKMIKQQSGRERAKKQALEELEATGKMSEQLLSSIREMSEPYQMTAAERALLQAAGSPKVAEDGTGINATMISPDIVQSPNDPLDLPKSTDTPEPTSASPDEIKAYATAAQRLFSNQQFEEAESSYDKILRVDPLNFSARCNLAVAQVRQGKLDNAITNLKKVLAYNYDNDFPHYLLGTVYLRQGKLGEAAESINTALKIKDDNGDGHFALGLIYTKQKKFSAAEQEFKETVRLNPAHGDAHFNLAIIYATSENPKLDLAKSHYRLAISNGATPDANLDRLLRGR